MRTKEIGIRKAVGATTANLIWLLSSDFLKLVVTANLIAWPLAYYAATRWLENYHYRIDIGIQIFVASGLSVLLMALLAVGFQVYRAASADPTVSLRHE